jgi:single-strand DNA-binding protein
LIGRWTKQPELKYTPNGKPVAQGTLAVQRSFKNAQGEYDADFINVVIWGKIAETIANKCEKGSRIGGTGRIQTRSWDGQDGKRQYATEVVIDNVTIIDWPENGQRQNNQGNQNQNQGNQNQGRQYEDPFAGGQIDIKDDDLPF